MTILFCDNSLDLFLNFRGDVAKHYYDLGHSIHLTVPEDSVNASNVKTVPKFINLKPISLNRNSTNILGDLVYVKSLYNIVKTIVPDLIFTYTVKPNIYGSIIGKMSRIPVVAMVAGLGYVFNDGGILKKLARVLYKLGLRCARKVIVLNQSNFDLFKIQGFANAKNLILFPYGEGVDVNHYEFVEDDYTVPRFLMVARVLYDKGYTEFVEAARIVRREYPEIKFELLGPLSPDSPMGVPEYIVRKDHEKGVINYLGETKNVLPYLQKSGVVVVVSSYHEGFNRSLMEAASMGRISITSDIPGCKEIVENEMTGLLVPPKNAKELADAMMKIIEKSPEERVKMARQARKQAEEHFPISKVINSYDKIISDLLSKRIK